MKFLTPKDIAALIASDSLSVVTQGNDLNLLTAELAAKEEMASHLASRYDVTKVFPVVEAYNPSKNYLVGELCYYYDPQDQPAEGNVYKANQPVLNETPDSSNKWDQEDPRNPIIILYLVDITLYHLHSAITPRNVPENRGLRYDRAIQWLRDVTKLQVNPDLPLLSDIEPDRVRQIIHGGQRRRTNTY